MITKTLIQFLISTIGVVTYPLKGLEMSLPEGFLDALTWLFETLWSVNAIFPAYLLIMYISVITTLFYVEMLVRIAFLLINYVRGALQIK